MKGNRWYWLFYIFCRITLAFGFFSAGMVKIVGERFASGLSVSHPMGAYLEALHHTGYYYTFIGFAQVIAAILLIIPRTVTLGALLYFPIIINIWILSFAVRFDGSFVSSPLMVMANLYILVWNYDKLKYILPFKTFPDFGIIKRPEKYNNSFPWVFFSTVFMIFTAIVLYFIYGNSIMPRNTLKDCKVQFINTVNETAGSEFCECIHNQGQPLDQCLENYKKATK
ncbi:DoxX family protein [Winogradskyella pulchriflava]|uniref:DoxX family protein n=1 Tax=Winogradskyella pulchriflava TaxID=1110688 RepID=A0ABV6QCP4_9FLAO